MYPARHPSGMVDEFDISGSNGRRVQLRAARGSKKAEPRRNSFGKRKKAAFLAHFAATCNAKAAARAAGVAHSTVYVHRRTDPMFRAAWEEALDQGYARIEAELVRRASESVPVEADEQAADEAAAAMDPKVALAVLESYRRNRGAKPGEILPQVVDRESARARLEAVMVSLKIIEADSDEQPHPRSPSASRPSPEEEGRE